MLKNLRRPDWTTDSQQCHGCSLCRVRGRGHKNMSADTDINFGIFTEADLRISQRTIYTFLIRINQLLFGQSSPKSPHPTQKKFQFYNRPTVHSRFQYVSHNKHPPSQLPATMSLQNKKHRISVRVVQPWPFWHRSTIPNTSETTTHPNNPMKRFKKRTLNHPLKNLNNTTPSPSFHRPNKKPRKQHAPPNFQADD